MLPMQGAWIPSLVREIDPSCYSKDLVQLNKYIIFFKMDKSQKIRFENQSVLGSATLLFS